MTRRLQLRLGWLMWGISGVIAPEWTVRRYEKATRAGVVAPEWRLVKRQWYTEDHPEIRHDF